MNALMKLNRFIVCAAVTVGSSQAMANAPFTDNTLSVDAIVAAANCVAYYQGRSGRAESLMVITDANGNERTRQSTVIRRDAEDGKCGQQKMYVYFTRPADMNKTSFIVWKEMQKEDDRWLYLPAMDLVKRIAASDERTSFVGSHVFYEDLSGRKTDADTHELVGITDTQYVLNNVPKDPKSVEFSSYKMWIDRATFVPMKAEYLDRNGNVYRTVEVLATETIQGNPTITKAKVSDTRIGGETVVTFSGIEYDINVDDAIFSERYLRNPPKDVNK